MFPSQTWYPSSCVKETQFCYTCLNIQLHNPVNNYIFIFSLIVAHFRPSPVDFGNTAQGTPVSSPENFCSPLLYILISYLVILHDLAHYESESVTQLCLTLCNPSDYGPPGSSIHEILQAGILEWCHSWPRDYRTRVSCIVSRFFTIFATRDVPPWPE